MYMCIFYYIYDRKPLRVVHSFHDIDSTRRILGYGSYFVRLGSCMTLKIPEAAVKEVPLPHLLSVYVLSNMCMYTWKCMAGAHS